MSALAKDLRLTDNPSMISFTKAGIIAGAAALLCALAGPDEVRAQSFSDNPDRYVDSYSLPGVRKNPRPARVERCVERLERVMGRDGLDRMENVTICENNGVAVRSSGSGMWPPYGPPVGGYSGLGGADTR